MVNGPYDVYLTMLFVDQGMGHLLTITPDGKPSQIQFNALLDFGGASRVAADTVEFVYDAITKNGKANGKLDLITISHRDRDHWNLFPHLLTMLANNNKTFEVGDLRYGDTYGNYASIASRNETVLQYLGKYVTKPHYKLEDYPDSKSAFSSLSPLPDILKFGANVRIRPVAVNAPVFTSSEMSDTSTLNNTPSLAVEIKYDVTASKSSVILLPGDATADTLFFINKILAQANAAELKNVSVLSVPHHGAVHSIASNYDSDNPDFDIANKFAKKVHAKTVGASAGFRTYRHPDADVLGIFKPYADTKTKSHYYVAYLRNINKWRKMITLSELYTNYITADNDLVDPRDPRRTVFKLGADGTTSVLQLLPKGASVITAKRRVKAYPTTAARPVT